MSTKYNPVSQSREEEYSTLPPVNTSSKTSKPFSFTLAYPLAGAHAIRKHVDYIDGVVVKKAMASAKKWTFKTVGFSTFAEFSQELFLAEASADCCVLRGLPAAGLPQPAFRRSVNFLGVGNVIALDIDHMELPPGTAAPTTAADFEALATAIYKGLPEPFAGLGAIVQYTSGMGLGDGVRARIWFATERPVTEPEITHGLFGGGKVPMLRLSGGTVAVDAAAFRDVQPIYLAAPVFGSGMKNTVPGPRIYPFGNTMMTAEAIDAEIDLHGYTVAGGGVGRVYTDQAHIDFPGPDNPKSIAHFADQLHRAAHAGGMVPGTGGRVLAYRDLAGGGLDVGCSVEHVQEAMAEWCAAASPTRPGEMNFVDDAADTAETCAAKFLTFEGSRRGEIGSRWDWVVDAINRATAASLCLHFGAIPDDELAADAADDHAGTVISLAKARAERAARQPGATAATAFNLRMGTYATPATGGRWMLKDLFPAIPGEVGLIVAPPSAGKSTNMVGIAAALAGGTDYLGAKNLAAGRQGVLIVSGESSTETAWSLEALRLAGCPLMHADMPKIDDLPAMLDAADAMMREQFGVPLNVVFFDTWSKCFNAIYDGRDENSATAVQDIFERLMKLARHGGRSLSMWCLHHTGKDTARGPRGSSAFDGNAAAWIICEKKRDEMVGAIWLEKAKGTTCSNTRLGYLIEGEFLWNVTIDRGDLGPPEMERVTGSIVRPALSVPVRQRALTGNQDAVLRALAGAGGAGLTEADWLAACVIAAVKPSTARDAIAELIARNLVREVGGRCVTVGNIVVAVPGASFISVDDDDAD